jgi:multidrug efflux system outer membrane protein
MKLYFIITVLIGLLTNCSFTPKYNQPLMDLSLEKEKKTDVIYLSWQNFFSSPAVQKVIEEALHNNTNYKTQKIQLQILAKQYDISRMRILAPNINASAGYNKTNDPLNPPLYTAGIFASYEIDIFGTISALKARALSSFLSEKENIKALHIFSYFRNCFLLYYGSFQ